MKRILSILVCMVMLLTMVPAVSASEAYGSLAYSYIQYINENHAQRTSGSDKELAMAQWISEQLTSFGYTPEIQNFSYSRRGTTYNSQNVVAVKPGNSTKQIIVGAHYDSVDTKGVDDNGSGTVVTLETAKRIFNQETPYTIVFVFFGAEETGLKGSGAYANAMTAEDIANTVCMINLDSILAGTYRYVYSGTVNSNDEMTLSWPFYQAMAISETLGLDMHSNDTDLNYDYPSPSTGSWSDHQSFRNLDIPYLYFEAANWELPDYEGYPQYGSSGAFETETGEVMHVPGRDDLTFIESEWGTRGKDTLAAYCELLSNLLYTLTPYELDKVTDDNDGILSDVDEIIVTITGPEAEKITFYDSLGNEIEADTTYENGVYTSKFEAFEAGDYAFDVYFYNGGKWVEAAQWVDTEVDVLFTVNASPKINGVEDGKLYSKAKNITVTDDDLATVTLNGETASDSFTVSNEGTYEIVATDALGISTTVKFEIKSIANIKAMLDDITKEDVNSDDLDDIDEVLAQAEEVLNNEDLTEDEKASIETIKDKADELIKQVEDAHAAVGSEEVEKAVEISKDDVVMDDKEVLEKAKEELEAALENYGNNYTENEKETISEKIDNIDEALAVIANVEDFEAKIDQIPEEIKIKDEDLVKELDDSYNALSDYEKTLVSKEAKDALSAAKLAIDALKNPPTGDNTYIVLWGVLMMITTAVLFTVTRKKVTEK